MTYKLPRMPKPANKRARWPLLIVWFFVVTLSILFEWAFIVLMRISVWFACRAGEARGAIENAEISE